MIRSTIAGPRLFSMPMAGLLLACAGFFAALPPGPDAGATGRRDDTLVAGKKKHDDGLPNYDIRRDKNAYGKLAAFRNAHDRSASDVADQRDDLARAEDALRAKVPTAKIEYSPEMGTPEVITPDVTMARSVLAGPTGQKRSTALKTFLQENKRLIGATREQIDGLKLVADYRNPDGNLGFVEYNQEINGVPVFRGAITAAYSKDGELIRVINNFAPGLDDQSISSEFGDASAALSAAARHIGHELSEQNAARDAARSDENKVHFGQGDWSPVAEKIYFPTEPGVVVPAWRVIIWQPLHSYMVIVDAASGEMLWRKNATEDQTQSATFDVFTNSQAMINLADSPSPAAPTVFDPSSGTQGLPVPRNTIVRIGNESPYNFNNLGWMSDATNTTDGNNVESGLDLGTPEGLDAGSQAVGEPYRVFTSTWNPPPGIPGPGDAPTDAVARRGVVIQQFYIMNLFHDELYRLGFTESARNFQTNNFGRGGIGNDRISAESQDFASTNNANFTTFPDGVRGKMQMFVFTAPNPDRDGGADAEIMIHEAAHGVSNRLIGNASGLTANMARAMGEGWSDFYAHCLLSEPGDPAAGVYPLSGYLLLNAFGAVSTQNYYYGIRRFPKALMSATGGPNNRPYNPLTFADIDQTKVNTGDGAYPAMFGAHISTTADQVHAAGEVWSSALWEVRGRLVQRLGWSAGNRKALQLVTDAMKVTPINPTFLQGRDALLAVAMGSSPTSTHIADVSDIWAGFAVRGMGVNAAVLLQGTGDGDARITESFERPNLLQLPAFSFSDSGGDNDGIAEPGESIVLTVPLTNVYGESATTVGANLDGTGATMYGTIPNAQTVTRQFNYSVPANTACGSLINLSLNVTSSLGAKTFTLALPIGIKSVTLQENFESATVPALPNSWTTATQNSGLAWGTTTAVSDTAPAAAFASAPNHVGSSDLISPAIQVNSAAATVTFRNRFNTEGGFDGGVLEISINNGPYQDILANGGMFITGGYNGTIDPDTNSPIAGRAAWTENSINMAGAVNGWVTTTAQLPPAANGQSIRLRWRLGTDASIGGTGWFVDTVVVRATSSCSFAGGPSTVRSRGDFDGDGKTDLAVFRPSEGNWYAAPSMGGIRVTTWGVSTDELCPGDFDGDGRADLAVFRPTVGSSPDFFIMKSNGFVIDNISWGDPGDKPVIGDYDGDGKDDVGVFRASNNTWYIIKTTGILEVIPFGQTGDVAVPGKFDADNKTDLAVYRNGQWIVMNSTGGSMVANWGEPGDILVPADYDGDDRDDVAVWRPSTGFWYIRRSSNLNLDIFSWGQTGDVPVPGDYDGDGKDDPAVYRNGVWYQVRSSEGLAGGTWGVATDIPIPRKYVP